jgi:hypothetical protein
MRHVEQGSITRSRQEASNLCEPQIALLRWNALVLLYVACFPTAMWLDPKKQAPVARKWKHSKYVSPGLFWDQLDNRCATFIAGQLNGTGDFQCGVWLTDQGCQRDLRHP